MMSGNATAGMMMGNTTSEQPLNYRRL